MYGFIYLCFSPLLPQEAAVRRAVNSSMQAKSPKKAMVPPPLAINNSNSW
jgi:hypothetical protein